MPPVPRPSSSRRLPEAEGLQGQPQEASPEPLNQIASQAAGGPSESLQGQLQATQTVRVEAVEELCEARSQGKPRAPRTVRVEVESGKDGLHLDASSRALQVLRVDPGDVTKYNDAAPAEQHVLVDDFVVDVNGVKDPLEMLKVFANSAVLVLEFMRPIVVSVVVNKSDQPLGLDLRFSAGSQCIEIIKIDRGAIEDHNASVPPEQQVKRFDMIRSANGVNRKASVAGEGKRKSLPAEAIRPARTVTKLLEELGRPGALRLELLRLPGAPEDEVQ